jgi:hypothetical protein
MILHGPENIAGVAGLIAAGQRELGLNAVSICLEQGAFGFKADYVYGARNRPRGRAVRDTLMDILTKVDTLHVYFGRSFLGPHLFDARLAAMLGKRVFYTFLGCDLRDKNVRLAVDTPSMCSDCHPQGCSANRAFARDTALAGKEAIFVSTPDLCDELPKALYLPLPVRDILGPKPAPFSARNGGPLRVLHAPTDSGKKGTSYIHAAIQALQKRGIPIELVQPGPIEQSDLFKLALSCDVAIDQIMAGVYGTFAAEMMMLGLPVIARIDPLYRPRYPDDLPIISAGREDLGQILSQICAGHVDINGIGKASREFALREHGFVQVAKRVTALY